MCVCHSYLLVDEKQMKQRTWERRKQAYVGKNKSVRISFSLFVDLLTINTNWNSNCCYECSNFMMHVLTSSLYRINRYRLFDLISHKLLFFNIAHRIHLKCEKNNGKSSCVVLTVVGTNTLHSWSFFFFRRHSLI